MIVIDLKIKYLRHKEGWEGIIYHNGRVFQAFGNTQWEVERKLVIDLREKDFNARVVQE